MSWRKGPDETLIHPRRGKVPPCPDGYERTVGNPYVVKRILPMCEHREIVPRPEKCCGYTTDLTQCNYFNRYITRSKCVNCDVPTTS